MTSIHIEIQAEKAIMDFRRFEERTMNMWPIFSRLQTDLRSIMKRQFDSEGAYLGGEKWEELAPTTVLDKILHNKRGALPVWDMRILHRTTKMRKSFTVGTGAIRSYGGKSFTFEGAFPAGIHQAGAATGKPPQRIIFQWTQTHQLRWVKAIQNWIFRGDLRITPL